MKLLLTLFSFVFITNTFAQTQDLITLAKGDFLGMNALFDEKGNLFGYISLYDYGRAGEKTKKFEYVVMDKNLNPFANKTFEGDITAGNYFGYINFDGKIVLAPTQLDMSMIKQKEGYTPSSMVIDLKDNSIKKKVFYDFDHGTFKEKTQHDSWAKNKKEYKAEKKDKGFNYVSYVSEIKEGGFLVLDYYDYGTYTTDKRVLRYDENKKELWKYEYNKDGSKKASQILNYLENDDKYFYGLLHDRIKKENKYYLVVLDMKSGKEVHKKEIPDPEEVLPMITGFQTYSYGSLDNDKTFDDKIVIVGRTFGGLFFTGFSRLLIDKKTFDVDLRILDYKDDFKGHVPHINGQGYVEKQYMLDPRDIFFLKDGSVGILFEKYKFASQYTAQKTSDMVYVYTDKNFKIAGAKVFDKEKSKNENGDYLFAQNLNNDKDLVFFYKDYQKDDETKDRNWNLFINTYIGGKFNQEMIPISSKKNFVILPYVAKEGYILLREYNVKSKYNQARLERLNY